MRAHEVKLVSWASQLSLQALDLAKKPRRLVIESRGQAEGILLSFSISTYLVLLRALREQLSQMREPQERVFKLVD